MTRLVLSLLLLSSAALASPSACKEEKAGLAAKARVTCAAARAAALAKVPGAAVRSSELEEEHGRLVYSFDLATRGKDGIDEVQVDAVSGAVVSVEHEDAAAEAAEKKADRAAGARHK